MLVVMDTAASPFWLSLGLWEGRSRRHITLEMHSQSQLLLLCLASLKSLTTSIRSMKFSTEVAHRESC